MTNTPYPRAIAVTPESTRPTVLANVLSAATGGSRRLRPPFQTVALLLRRTTGSSAWQRSAGYCFVTGYERVRVSRGTAPRCCKSVCYTKAAAQVAGAEAALGLGGNKDHLFRGRLLFDHLPHDAVGLLAPYRPTRV